MRSRNIKPGFFLNEELAEGGPCGQILFEGLWCMADRQGILEYRPKRIKAQVFPYYDPKDFGGKDIFELLQFLADKHFIRFYSAKELKLIYIVNFRCHQSPHHTEKESTLPLPLGDLTVSSPIDNGESTVNPRKSNGGNPPDSLIPDLLIPDSKDLADLPSAGTPKISGRDFEKEFNDQFYPAYPNKKKPAYALQCYVNKGKKGLLPTIEVLLAALEDQKTWPEWTKDAGKFIDHPSTWIKGECWRNERTSAPMPASRRKYADLKTNVIVND